MNLAPQPYYSQSQNQVQSSSQKCPKLLLLSSVVEIYATFRILIIAGIRKTVYKAVIENLPFVYFLFILRCSCRCASDAYAAKVKFHYIRFVSTSGHIRMRGEVEEY